MSRLWILYWKQGELEDFSLYIPFFAGRDLCIGYWSGFEYLMRICKLKILPQICYVLHQCPSLCFVVDLKLPEEVNLHRDVLGGNVN